MPPSAAQITAFKTCMADKGFSSSRPNMRDPAVRRALMAALKVPAATEAEAQLERLAAGPFPAADRSPRDTSPMAVLSREFERVIVSAVIVYAVVDDPLSADFPLGVELEVFIRREDAERFIEEVRGDEPEMAAKLRI